MELFNKGAEELNKAKKAAGQAAENLDSAMQELADDAVNRIAGGGSIFDDVPPVIEHPYDPGDPGRY